MKHRLIIITSIILIAGCVSKEPEYKWVKTNNDSKEKEYIIADSTCLAEAYKASPVTPSSDCGKSTGFANGFCMGENAGNARNAKELREKFYDGCMLSKGWEKQSIK